MNQLTGGRTVTFTTTETADQNSAPILYLVHLKNVPPGLHKLSREVFDIACDAFTQLYDFFHRERDLLSLRLQDWILNFLVNDAYTDHFDEEFLKDVEARVRTLWQEILVNPLDGTPITEPIIVKGKVWEKKTWNELNSLAPQPPCEVRIHKFAAALIKVMDMFPKVETTPPTLQLAGTVFSPLQAMLPAQFAPSLTRAEFAQLSPDFNKLIYSRLLINSACTDGLRGMQQQMIEHADKCSKLWEEARNSKLAHIAAAEKDAREHLERLNQCETAIEKSHEATIQILNGLIEEQQREIRANASTLNALKTRGALQQAEARLLRRELNDQFVTIVALQQKVKHKKSRGWGF